MSPDIPITILMLALLSAAMRCKSSANTSFVKKQKRSLLKKKSTVSSFERLRNSSSRAAAIGIVPNSNRLLRSIGLSSSDASSASGSSEYTSVPSSPSCEIHWIRLCFIAITDVISIDSPTLSNCSRSQSIRSAESASVSRYSAISPACRLLRFNLRFPDTYRLINDGSIPVARATSRFVSSNFVITVFRFVLSAMFLLFLFHIFRYSVPVG